MNYRPSKAYRRTSQPSNKYLILAFGAFLYLVLLFAIVGFSELLEYFIWPSNEWFSLIPCFILGWFMTPIVIRTLTRLNLR